MSKPAIRYAHPYTSNIDLSPGAHAAIEDRVSIGDARSRTREALYYHLESALQHLQLGQTISVIIAHFGEVKLSEGGPAPIRLRARCVDHGDVLVMTRDEARMLPSRVQVGDEIIELHTDEDG